jgi:hypothetical protein
MGVEPLGKEVRFLIPMLRNSDRQLHDVAHWEWIDNEMHVRYPNGWQMREVERSENTVTGKVHGWWFDKQEGKPVPDDSIELVVAVPPSEMPALYTLFEEICARFDQKCVYFTNGGDAALFRATTETNAETG